MFTSGASVLPFDEAEVDRYMFAVTPSPRQSESAQNGSAIPLPPGSGQIVLRIYRN